MIATRDHLSWSQMICWEKGEQEYHRYYILGQRMNNRYTDFGRKIHEGLEKKETDDKEVEFCRLYIPTPAIHEPIIKVQCEKLPILIKPDGITRGKNPIIDEYKTGKAPWTQTKADSHGQLTFYDMAWYWRYKKIPDNRLIWIPTMEDEYGSIRLTGKIPQVFKTKRTITDIVEMYGRANDAWMGIQKFCKSL